MNCARSCPLVFFRSFVSNRFHSTLLMVMASVIASFAITLSAGRVDASVWTAQNNWSPEWERAYSAWVRSEWTKDFFYKTGPFQGVQSDCADAVYAMRLIFSYRASLPFAINDPTSGRRLISNEMTRWDRLSMESRVRSFLLYVMGMTSTTSLIADSFFVATSRHGIRSGVFIRAHHSSHHSWTVRDVSRTGVPHLLFATRPASARLYERYAFPSTSFLFAGQFGPESSAGFRMFRHSTDLKRPEWQVPGYSLEQFQMPENRWAATLQSRLAITAETIEEKLDRLLAESCVSARDRVDIVKQGADYLQRLGQRLCLNQVEFDDYSTPSRDRRLLDTFIALREGYREAVQSGATMNATLRGQIEEVLGPAGIGLQASTYCPVEYRHGRTLALSQVHRLVRAKNLSSNPHDTIEMRWGQDRWPSTRAARCPSLLTNAMSENLAATSQPSDIEANQALHKPSEIRLSEHAKNTLRSCLDQASIPTLSMNHSTEMPINFSSLDTLVQSIQARMARKGGQPQIKLIYRNLHFRPASPPHSLGPSERRINIELHESANGETTNVSKNLLYAIQAYTVDEDGFPTAEKENNIPRYAEDKDLSSIVKKIGTEHDIILDQSRKVLRWPASLSMTQTLVNERIHELQIFSGYANNNASDFSSATTSQYAKDVATAPNKLTPNKLSIFCSAANPESLCTCE